MEERTRAYRRQHRYRIVKNKRKLVSELYGTKEGKELFPVDGKLAKGKIHCSCPLCHTTVKTNGWKVRDKKQMLREQDYLDYLREEELYGSENLEFEE